HSKTENENAIKKRPGKKRERKQTHQTQWRLQKIVLIVMSCHARQQHKHNAGPKRRAVTGDLPDCASIAKQEATNHLQIHVTILFSARHTEKSIAIHGGTIALPL